MVRGGLLFGQRLRRQHERIRAFYYKNKSSPWPQHGINNWKAKQSTRYRRKAWVYGGGLGLALNHYGIGRQQRQYTTDTGGGYRPSRRQLAPSLRRTRNTSSAFRNMICDRCGRRGHSRSYCYARRHIQGFILGRSSLY